ncbi:MAG: 2Fe-2S ferredoxin [Geminicoccaceae bacterium]|nr:MAG: 2Fe-2S ferredoxin [Geminicoccaceae bacterium]
MIELIVTELDGSVRRLQVEPTGTIRDVARACELSLECTCGGQMACATCHVVVDPEWAPRLATPSVEEREMLELAVRPRRHSRLGCQLRLSPELDGLAFRVVGE